MTITPANMILKSNATLLERPSLLIVDDQPTNIQLLYRIFQGDHQVFMATSGVQALELCERTPPDLILLDIMMPEMDGFELCQRLHINPATATIPIIFVTARNSPEEETRALEVGGVDFITKPVNQSVVRARVRTHLTLKSQSDLLRHIALVDGLTGIANRHHFEQRLDAEWRRARRENIILALIMLDVDHFKNYNDHYGHLDGDACLRTVASTVCQQLKRSHDLVARYGGEEFVCILPNTDCTGARLKAEEIRAAIETLALPHIASHVAPVVTISLGVAAMLPTATDTPKNLIAIADQALYMAKQTGRNRVGLIADPG